MASSSGKQKSTRPTPSTDEDLQNILDILDNDDDHDDDSTLADTDIEDGDSDDNDEDTETNFVNVGHNDVGTNINSSIYSTKSHLQWFRQTFVYKTNYFWRDQSASWANVY